MGLFTIAALLTAPPQDLAAWGLPVAHADTADTGSAKGKDTGDTGGGDGGDSGDSGETGETGGSDSGGDGGGDTDSGGDGGGDTDSSYDTAADSNTLTAAELAGETGGCSCDAGASGMGGLAWLAVGLLGWRRRR